MILQPRLQLEEKIVQTLMKQPNVTAAELWHVANQSDSDYSIQAIYKELRKLHGTGVVSKHGTHFALRIPWVLDVAALVEDMKHQYVDQSKFDHLLPGIGKKKIWHFTNLNTLNNFWSQVLLVAAARAKHKAIYGYSPHPWYHLLQTEQEDQYIQSLRHAGTKLYLMIGGQTFLDGWAVKYWPKDIVEHSSAKNSYSKEQAWYMDLIDDYLITVKLDLDTVRAIEQLYASTPDWEHLDLAQVLQLAQSKVRAALWVEHNPQKAKVIHKRFVRFFGIVQK